MRRNVTPEELAAMPHNASTYTNHGCRCAVCRTAHAVRQAQMRASRAAALEAGKVVVPHGDASTYFNYGCRCADCRRARRDQARRYRAARRQQVAS